MQKAEYIRGRPVNAYILYVFRHFQFLSPVSFLAPTMSLERLKATKGLIHIDDPQDPYTPGDIIAGRVFRQVPVIVGADSVRITIRLVGRSIIKRTIWSDHLGESQRTYTTRTDIFNPDESLLTLHDGPVHIPRTDASLADDNLDSRGYDKDAGESWPFTIVIPTYAWANSEQGPGENQTRKVPSTSYTERAELAPGEFQSGHIQYFLEARLVSMHSNNYPVAVELIAIGGEEWRSGHSRS